MLKAKEDCFGIAALGLPPPDLPGHFLKQEACLDTKAFGVTSLMLSPSVVCTSLVTQLGCLCH